MSKSKFYGLIIFVAMLLIATGCAKKEPPDFANKGKQQEASSGKPAESAQTGTGDQVQHKVLSFNLEGLNEKGGKKWDVKGESAEAISEDRVKLNNIVAKSYGEEAEATITADKGVYDKLHNNVKLEENVKATIENTKAFASDFMDLPGQATNKSKAKEAAQKKGKTVITCDGEVRFEYENNKAYFEKNVKVTSDDGNIDADKITVNLEPNTRKIKDIVAEGNVKITRGEDITYSEKAVYVEAEKKVILTGRPKIVIYQQGGLQQSILGK